jgi:hypothetical membrane protein
MKLKITTQHKLVKVLLICGILLPIIYVGVDAISAMLYKGYSYTDQAISELSAIGAPTSWIWVILNFVHNPLLIAFGAGVLMSAGQKRMLRITGILLIVAGVAGFSWLFFPINTRENIGSATNTGHLVVSAITVFLMTLYISFGSGAKGKGFRLYSILTVIVMLFFGFWTGTYVPRVAAQLPTPWMGIIERVSVFSPIIWVGVLGFILLRDQKEKEKIAE